MRAVIVSLVGIALCGSVMAAQSASDLAKGDAAKGKAIYVERKCATCHRTDKADDKGGKMSTVLGDTVGKLSPAEIRAG
jgi:cytochrome c2